MKSAKDSDKKAQENVSTERLNLVLGLVSEKFDLDESYRVSQFNDKGKVVNVTLENEDFSVAVSIKDSARHGIVVE